jgi:hypothetical protein
VTDIEITTRPRRLSEVREDMRTLCHFAVPAAGNLRDLATHLSRELPTSMVGNGFTAEHAETKVAELVKEISLLAAAADDLAKHGHRALEQLDEIKKFRNRYFPNTDNDKIDV